MIRDSPPQERKVICLLKKNLNQFLKKKMPRIRCKMKAPLLRTNPMENLIKEALIKAIL